MELIVLLVYCPHSHFHAEKIGQHILQGDITVRRVVRGNIDLLPKDRKSYRSE